MLKELYPSSYRCHCGHQVDFFETTVTEAKKASRKARQLLTESCVDSTQEHIIVFEHGKAVDILCPKKGNREKPVYTVKQGRYLAFIEHYTRLHRKPPAEADMQQYFEVSPPSVHQMVLTLEKKGFISRTPGQARSIKVLLLPDELPKLT